MNFRIKDKFCGKVTITAIMKRCKRSFSLQTHSPVCVYLTVKAISDVNCETFFGHALNSNKQTTMYTG